VVARPEREGRGLGKGAVGVLGISGLEPWALFRVLVDSGFLPVFELSDGGEGWIGHGEIFEAQASRQGVDGFAESA